MNKRINIYLMYLIVFLQGFVFYGPFSTIYRQARGLSMYNIFFIESIYWILMIAFEIPWGWVADRFGYKKTLVISNFLFFVSKIIFYKAYSFEMFLIERIILALVISGLSGCDVALLYSSVDKDESEKAFSRYNASAYAGFFIASILSSSIVKYSLDKTAFFTTIPYGIAAVLTLFLKEVKLDSEEKPKLRDSFRTAFKSKEIIIFVISIALIRETVQAVQVFLSQLQYLRSGIDIKYFGFLTAAIQIICLSSAKAYRLSSNFGKNKSVEVLYIMITINCFLLIVVSNPILTVTLIIIIAGSMSLIGSIALDIQNKTINTGDRATILSIYSMGGNLIAAFINPFIGKTADISIEVAFALCLVISICAYVLFALYKKMSEKG